MITLNQHTVEAYENQSEVVDILFETLEVPLHSFVCELCFDAKQVTVLGIEYNKALFHEPDCFLEQRIDNEHGSVFIACGFVKSCSLGCDAITFATVKVACKTAITSLLQLGEQTEIHVLG